MMNRNEENQQQTFSQALEGKKIPILTLDNKWYHLFTEEKRQEVSGLEQQLNALLKQQGKLNPADAGLERKKQNIPTSQHMYAHVPL